MKRFLRRFAADTRANTAIEFAIVVPILFFILFTTMEVALIMFVKTGIESATSQAGRTGKTGYLEAKYATREEYIKSQINDKLGELLDTDALTITLKNYTDFAKIGEPEPSCTLGDAGCVAGGPDGGYRDVNGNGMYDEDMAAAGAGGAGAVVVYVVEYDYPLQSPILELLNYITKAYGGSSGKLPFISKDINGDGKPESILHMTSRVVVQNEVFP